MAAPWKNALSHRSSPPTLSSCIAQTKYLGSGSLSASMKTASKPGTSVGRTSSAAPSIRRTRPCSFAMSNASRVTREAFDMAKLHGRVRLIEGAALDVLPTLVPGFDAVFIDADKEPLPKYFVWAMQLLRVGGLLLCDNAFFHGAAIDPGDTSGNAVGVRKLNELAAKDPRLAATIVQLADADRVEL